MKRYELREQEGITTSGALIGNSGIRPADSREWGCWVRVSAAATIKVLVEGAEVATEAAGAAGVFWIEGRGIAELYHVSVTAAAGTVTASGWWRWQ